MSLRPTVDFLLYDWLKVDQLRERARYAEHSRETFDAVLDTCERIAREKYAPFNRTVDIEEPRMEGDKVILPQALAHVVPGIMNNFIAIFKDTSLVTIVSLYELSGALSLALSGDADWRPYKIEAYLFIALIYFVFCFGLSSYSQRWQQRLQHRTP